MIDSPSLNIKLIIIVNFQLNIITFWQNVHGDWVSPDLENKMSTNVQLKEKRVPIKKQDNYDV